MMKKIEKWQVFPRLIAIAFSFLTGAWAQSPDVAAKLGYPQMVVYNGKIVTMDNESFTSQVGTIVQAMAIRDGKILATGNNAEIRALAGPQTRQLDLKGRAVMPSFILTHEHPTDWVFIEPQAFRHVLPNDDVIVSRWMPNLPPKEQMARFEGVVKEAAAKAKPEQWLRVVFNWGPDYEWATEMQPLFGKSITKEWLDELAPNNPVTVKDGFISSASNAKAVEEMAKVRDMNTYIPGPGGGGAYGIRAVQTGRLGRPVDPDAMLRGKIPLLADLLKAEMELWARYGITSFGSSPYAYSNLQALNLLDQRGEMPGRFAWGYTGPSWDLETLRVLAGAQGHGTDHLWLLGAWRDTGSGCMTVPIRADWIEQERQENPDYTGQQNCNFAPETQNREILERIIESGLRIATLHTGGDQDIDFLMDAIETASKRAGFSLEEIRAKRHAFDHASGAPRPEQIPRVKNLGMMVSMINTILWETHRGASMTAKQYGLEYTNWVVPRKSVTEAGIMNTFEIDRPLPHKIFFFITKGMNRYNDRDQQVYGPAERTDRITQLKALTVWGGYYVMREHLMGTLEPGRFADFIVLDRDLLTVPEAEIPQTQVLMTVVGGKTVHLGSVLAREAGMQPVGPTTWTEPMPDGWEPKSY
ncbi:MAG: amidohydrolase family protein [Acidobacteria bacterium]|nr:amidohydrolase family protein [Acidobacteriota bacterium]